MALTVKNNKLATVSLGELNKNIVEKGKRMAKLASGKKIVGAADGAADWSVSEKMRVQIRGLFQDIENTKNGTAMLKVAEGGLQDIINELRSLKELALNAANDHNSDYDREILQRDFDQKKADIQDIACSTNYNGKLLLDGTYSRRYIDVKNTQEVEETGGDKGAKTISVLQIPVPEPTNAETMMFQKVSDSVYKCTISSGGVYTIPENFLDGKKASDVTINIEITSPAAVGGVKIKQTDTSSVQDMHINVEPTSSGKANLWLEDLNATTTGTSNLVNFVGGNGYLTLSGNNNLYGEAAAPIIKFHGSNNNVLSIVGDSKITSLEQNQDYAAVNIGGGLTVQGLGTKQLTIQNGELGDYGVTKEHRGGAGIGSDKGEQLTGDIKVINANLEIITQDGACIGSGQLNAKVGNIEIINSNIDMHGDYNACIGSGQQSSSVGNITIRSSNISSVNIDTGIGSGFNDATCGKVLIEDTVVNIKGQLSACIGAGDASTCGDVEVSNSVINTQSQVGAGIGSGQNNSSVGNIIIKNATTVKHKAVDLDGTSSKSTGGAAIGSGAHGHADGTLYISKSSLDLFDGSEAYSDGTHNPDYLGIGRGYQGTAANFKVEAIADDYEVQHNKYLYDNPLVIHTGTKSNQALHCYIDDMRLHSLGFVEADTGKDKVSIATRSAAELAIGGICEENWHRDDIPYDKATTAEKNNPDNYLGPIDKAINYALNQSTLLGAYMNELNYTAKNLTTAHENTISAESTIRDADMAKEMTGFVKANVLSQSSQAMLAQANQVSSNVLNLLQ